MVADQINSTRLENILSKESDVIQTPLANRNVNTLRGNNRGNSVTGKTVNGGSASKYFQGNTNDGFKNRIMVENTPTPFLVRKFQKVASFDIDVDDTENLVTNKKKITPKQQRVIPNTPAVHNTISLTNQASSNLNNNTRRVSIF
jgi:hypothetical protein